MLNETSVVIIEHWLLSIEHLSLVFYPLYPCNFVVVVICVYLCPSVAKGNCYEKNLESSHLLRVIIVRGFGVGGFCFGRGGYDTQLEWRDCQ